MSNLVETLPPIENEMAYMLITVLDRLELLEGKPIILYQGTDDFEYYKNKRQSDLCDLTVLCDSINPYEYNCIYITKNGSYEKHTDVKRFGPKLSISVGQWTGNKLLIDGEHVCDHNRAVIFDGTKVPHETTPHKTGLKYNLMFYKF
jgi:hypothetical protein